MSIASTKPSDAQELFRAAMTDAGIECTGEIYADGRLHRFKAADDRERNSWYVLHLGPPTAGAFGCWKRGLKQTWCDRSNNLSQGEWIEVRRRWEQADREHERTKTERQRKARRTAAWILARAKPVITHAYLNAKQVQSHGELREYRGALVLPLRDLDGELHSLQFTGADGLKNFLTGGRVTGCFFTLADKAEGPVVICEGYCTGASIYEATGHSVICCMNCGNLLDVAKAVRELWSQREIIVAADNDQFTDGNPGLTKASAAAKAIHAKLAVPQFKDIANKPTDFNDLATVESLDAVKEQVGAAQIPTETDGDTFARLAALSPAEYDRCRETEAAALHIRVTTLDAEVERLRRWTGGNDSTLQGCPIDLPDVEPWPQPVDGAEILEAISGTFSEYLALPPGAADAMALWVAHSHCFEVFEITPRLNITSPEKGCGKTTAGDVVSLFVPRSLRAENLTPAVLFRVIEKRKPTVFADEYDNWLRDNDELRGMLNAGHRRGGKALRCEGDNHEVRAFRVFGPVVLCGIGALPGPLHDRSIVIRLERAKPGEIRKRFDSRHTDHEAELCRKLARWCIDNRTRLESCDPTLPEGAFNRLADNWRPPFAIAQIAGGDWPRRTAAAFDKLTRREDLEAQGIGVMLLADIQQVFAGMWPSPPDGESPLPLERIFSKKLVEALCEMRERPWSEAHRGKQITESWLARHLRRFSLHSTTLRIGNERAKGYKKTDFTDAFDRYVFGLGQFTRDSVTCEEKSGFGAVTCAPVVTDEKPLSTEGMSRCHAQDTLLHDEQHLSDSNSQLIQEEALLL
jgi:putative DNA primase/helicase